MKYTYSHWYDHDVSCKGLKNVRSWPSAATPSAKTSANITTSVFRIGQRPLLGFLLFIIMTMIINFIELILDLLHIHILQTTYITIDCDKTRAFCTSRLGSLIKDLRVAKATKLRHTLGYLFIFSQTKYWHHNCVKVFFHRLTIIQKSKRKTTSHFWLIYLFLATFLSYFIQ